MVDVLGFRVAVVMMRRLCKRHSRRSNSRNDKNRKEFLQKIVHEANLIIEGLMTGFLGAFEMPGQCSAAFLQAGTSK